MKEISEVIKGFEIEKNKEEQEKKYRKYFFRVKVLLKNDLCELVELDNIDEYTKIEDYLIPIHKFGKLFYLYRNNLTKNLHYISKYSPEQEKNSGIIIKTDHISNIDADIVIKKALMDQEIINNKTNGFSDVLFGVGILIVFLAIITFIITIEEGFLSIVITAAFIIVAFIMFALSILMTELKTVNKKLVDIEKKIGKGNE